MSARWGTARTIGLSIIAALVVGALMVLLAGANPIAAYQSIVSGSLTGAGLIATLELAMPIVGCALAVAIPLRAGVINLGGEGQIVAGGLAGVLVAQAIPDAPAPIAILTMLLAAGAAGALIGAIPAILDNRLGVPLLFSSLLLSYPIVAVVSYVVRFPLLDGGTGLPQTKVTAEGFHMPDIAGITGGVLLILVIGLVLWFVDAKTPYGFEVRMTGHNRMLTDYIGVRTGALAIRTMSIGGAIAGISGALLVAKFPYRLIDGMLITPQYVWTGLLAAMLARAHPLGAVVAGTFFAALQIGGAEMERDLFVPRELGSIIQAVLILALAIGLALRARKKQKVA